MVVTTALVVFGLGGAGIAILFTVGDQAYGALSLIIVAIIAGIAVHRGLQWYRISIMRKVTQNLVDWVQDHKAEFYALGIRPRVGQCGVYWVFEANCTPLAQIN